ncbi:hypothetical protein FQR65_LT19424 [Abscondita terminalis]|nr:hypothetical protein FQR65_LT19424 [Abscondita terminalis]
MGNPNNPSYVPDRHESINFYWVSLPTQTAIMQRYFPGAPDLKDLFYNVSLSLVNSHFTNSLVVANLPNVVEIGGLHVRPPQRLPQDVQKFLDGSKDGVVYFCMGSILKTHPNIRLFITHGGLLSVTEAIHFGVPIIGIPIFADQKLNVKLAEDSGFAISLEYALLNKNVIKDAIERILTNSKFSIAAKTKSKIYHDQLTKPLDRGIYWIEYCIRHQGAHHLRSYGLNLYWYQYLMLDILAVIVGAIVLVSLASTDSDAVVLKPEDVPGAVFRHGVKIEDHSNFELRRWLECRGLKKFGNKAELTERIVNCINMGLQDKIFLGVDDGKWYDAKRNLISIGSTSTTQSGKIVRQSCIGGESNKRCKKFKQRDLLERRNKFDDCWKETENAFVTEEQNGSGINRTLKVRSEKRALCPNCCTPKKERIPKQAQGLRLERINRVMSPAFSARKCIEKKRQVNLDNDSGASAHMNIVEISFMTLRRM